MARELNSVTHSIRATQLLRYGVGSLTDFPDQTLTVTKPEIWPETRKIFDDRFARFLGVDYFITPEKVAYCRFPKWYFCPLCSTLRKLDDWIYEYRRLYKDQDDDMLRHMRCTNPKCKRTPLIAAGIVVACEAGHINDFPWVEWAHSKAHKPICSKPDLRIYTTGADSLDATSIICKNCGAKSTLQGAFGERAFESREHLYPEIKLHCSGFQPFNCSHSDCHLYPKALRRGASSVYYPTTVSSLVIPPYSDKIRAKIEQSSGFETFMKQFDLFSKNPSMIDAFIDIIHDDTRIDKSDIKKILEEKIARLSSDSENKDETNYRFAEYEVLSGRYKTATDTENDFICKKMDPALYKIPQIKSISLIQKVRVITASIGFSRVKPVSDPTSKNFISIKDKSTRYYPAYETRGEGIFIELDQKMIDQWLKNNPEILDRTKLLTKNYQASFSGAGKSETISPKLVLLHTFSHLLIRQLSFECGYGVSSLNERIYYQDGNGDKDMAGVFIYTASGDSEGTLGGLIRQGEPDALPNTIKKTISAALYCSNDPVCAMSSGQGREALNLSACHACTLLPETSCENGNIFLDRTFVSGTLFNQDIGFFSSVKNLDVAAIKPEEEEISGTWGQKPDQDPSTASDQDLDVNYVPGENFNTDFKDWDEAAAMFDSLDSNKIKNIPTPSKYGGKFVINNKYSIEILFTWDSEKIALIDSEITEPEKVAISALGWKVYEAKEDINSSIKEIFKEK